ncbi:hypothetical protein P8452_47020 [Trifolium repens]|nr:hypothetical protein P8452_47020 [Trifolium repens]
MCFYGHRVMRLSKKEPERLDILKFDNLLTIDWFGINGSPTFYKITKKKDVEEFKTDPYLATVLNCAFWVFYGIGLVFEFVYLTIFIVYAKKAGRKKHLHGTTKRSLIVGILCDMFNIAMYVSPLTVMAMVIKTKSVKYMPFWLSVAKFLNGCCWTTYFIFYK